MFKAATIFQFPTSIDFSLLEDQCASHRAREPGPQELGTVGFLQSPLGTFVERTDDGALAVTVQYQDRKLPRDAVMRELTKRIKAFEDERGHPPGGRLRKQFQDEVVNEMLPRAFIQARNVAMILIPERGLCFIGTPSRKLAETSVSQLRYVLGSFPALPLNAECSVPDELTAITEHAGEGHGYQINGHLHATDDLLWLEGRSKETAKLKDVELSSDEVKQHIEADMKVVRMSMIYGSLLTFVFADDLVLRSMKVVDQDALADRMGNNDTAEDEWRARTGLTVWLLEAIYDSLARQFKFSEPPVPTLEAHAPAPADRPGLDMDAEDLA